MKPSEQYQAMAAWFRTHTFEPEGALSDDCGCFISAAEAVTTSIFENEAMPALRALIALDGRGGVCCLAARQLIIAGWTGPEATRDAEAACMIASDICAAEGR